VNGKRPDENEVGEKRTPEQPRAHARRQRAESDVGEQVARRSRHEEEKNPGDDAEDADPAGHENPRDPKRLRPRTHDGRIPVSRGGGLNVAERRGVAFHISRFHMQTPPPAKRRGVLASLLWSALGAQRLFCIRPGLLQ
jgi:hypothetical protein